MMQVLPLSRSLQSLMVKRFTSIDQLVELLQYYEPKEKIDVTVAVLDGNEYKEKTLTAKSW